MFAGRYLWWNMIAAMAYVFFAVYFYYVSWLAIRVSGCAAVAGSCGALETQLNNWVEKVQLFGAGYFFPGHKKGRMPWSKQEQH